MHYRNCVRNPSNMYSSCKIHLIGNEMILEKAQAETDEKNPEDEKDDDDSDQNSGTMIVDATCAPSQIKYPQDAALLNKARENTEKLIDTLHTPGEKKPRTYRQKAHYENNCHSIPDRIVSLSQPYLRPIVRGKAKAAVEFGAKLDISVCDGWTRLEKVSFDAYNESKNLPEMLERYKQRIGHYPSRVLADKIYRNRENLRYCKERDIRLSGPALGRPKKEPLQDKKQNYIDECERVEVERKFSLAKRKCGLGLMTTKLAETTLHSIALSIVVLNLRRIQYALWHFLFSLFLKTKITA